MITVKIANIKPPRYKIETAPTKRLTTGRLFGVDLNIAPKPTNYRGYQFRSRLEARWAVFFDALGIKAFSI